MVQRYDVGYADDIDVEDDGRFVSYEDYTKLKEAAEKALAVLEDYEVQIDNEWGTCRGIDQLYEDG